MEKAKKTSAANVRIGDRYGYLLLVVASLLVRLPFLKTFDLVTYDGTYYVNQAKAILGMMSRPLTFPVGYPAFIALFIPIVRDGVRAAQVVSFLAGLGSLFVLYALAKRYLSRSNALVCALLFALTPLFINGSMVTMSESIYLFWMLLGLYFFAREKDLPTGLSLGMGAVTRPEALGIFAVLALLRVRRPRGLAQMAGGFALLFCLNVAVQSIDLRTLTIYPHTRSFGSSAVDWKLREAWGDFPEKEKLREEVATPVGGPTLLADYAKRLPSELELLFRHVSPIIFLLSLYGIYRRRLFLLAALLPFLVFPLFTTRSEPRFILAYVPVIVLYAFMGMEGVPRRAWRRPSYALLIASWGFGFFIHRDQLRTPISDGYQWAKRWGIQFRGRVKPRDKIGDRKPFFAFYAGGRYVEIPEAPYEETVQSLGDQGVRYLALDGGTIQMFRPQLLPLLLDRAVIQGEMRFSQVFCDPSVGCVYESTGKKDPLERRYLVPPTETAIWGLSWSPDGREIAYHVVEASAAGGAIYAISTDGGEPRILASDPSPALQVAWAPDSRRIAFPMEQSGNTDIYVADGSGHLKRITSDRGKDISPSWSRDGSEMFFASDVSGASEIYSIDLRTGAMKELTTGGGNTCPAVSPDGRYLAWTREDEGVFIRDRATGATIRADAPKKVSFAPAWSPDGRFIAVTGADWGNPDIYLMTADGRNATLVTRSYPVSAGMPAWSPDGTALAVATLQDRSMGIAILTGLEAYEDRVTSPPAVEVFGQPRQGH